MKQYTNRIKKVQEALETTGCGLVEFEDGNHTNKQKFRVKCSSMGGETLDISVNNVLQNGKCRICNPESKSELENALKRRIKTLEVEAADKDFMIEELSVVDERQKKEFQSALAAKQLKCDYYQDLHSKAADIVGELERSRSNIKRSFQNEITTKDEEITSLNSKLEFSDSIIESMTKEIEHLSNPEKMWVSVKELVAIAILGIIAGGFIVGSILG